MNLRDRHAVLILVAGWVLAVAVVGVGPNVAIDDSWNFAGPTKLLLETGRIQFNPYNSAAAVPHILWGALVCKIGSFSFVACRIANLIAALFALLIAYWLARCYELDIAGSFVVAMMTALAPPFFITAFTYQSDFFFLIPAWAGLGFALRFFKTKRDLHLLLATLLFGFAIWNKVHGLLLAIALIVVLLLQRKRLAMRGVQWLIAAGVPAISYLLFRLATPAMHPVHTTLDRKTGELLSRLGDPLVWLGDGFERAAVLLLSLGLYALPVLLIGGLASRQTRLRLKTRQVLFVVTAVVVGAAAFWLVLYRGELYPFTSSVLREQPPLTNRALLAPLTALSLFGALGLLYHLLAAIAEAWSKRDESVLLIVSSGLLQALILVPILLFMDRYFLVLIPLALIVVMRRLERKPWPASQPFALSWRRKLEALLVRLGLRKLAPKYGSITLLTLALIVAMAFQLTDALRVWQYHQGIAAQWKMADKLVEAGHDPLTVDGGYSWFGWHNYPHCLQNKPVDFDVDLRHTPYVVELCPWAPIEYDVVFHELAPPRKLIASQVIRSPLLGDIRLFVYQRQ